MTNWTAAPTRRVMVGVASERHGRVTLAAYEDFEINGAVYHLTAEAELVKGSANPGRAETPAESKGNNDEAS